LSVLSEFLIPRLFLCTWFAVTPLLTAGAGETVCGSMQAWIVPGGRTLAQLAWAFGSFEEAAVALQAE
jgi:hypothetical protein